MRDTGVVPERPILVLLHAFPLTSALYAAQRDDLAGTAELLTPDLRGFGASPLGDDPPSLDLLADDVVRLLDERGVQRAVVGGTSMGGYVTLAMLRRHPDRVQAVLLSNTKASTDAPEARNNRLRIAATVEQTGVAVALAAMVPNLLGPTTTTQRPDLVVAVDELVATADPAAVAWAQRAMAARPESFDALGAFSGPVLVIAGAEDALMPLAEAEAMAATVPQSRLELLPSAGHLSCLERPDEWNEAVAGWLAGI
jgi:pimeloyl-ACP methyl ester carboxylesterase